jgi:hypothetical protein
MSRTSAAHSRRPDRAVAPTRNGPRLDRFAALESTLKVIQHTLDVQFKRMADMQAELDLLRAERELRPKREDE